MEKLFQERERFGAWTERTRKPARCPICKSSPVYETNEDDLPEISEELKKHVKSGRVILGTATVLGDLPRWRCHECGVYIFQNTVSDYFELDQMPLEELKKLVENKYHIHLKNLDPDDGMWLLTIHPLKDETAMKMKKEIWARVISSQNDHQAEPKPKAKSKAKK